MRALVTGGAGFIGSALVDRLLAEGHAVDAVDDLSGGSLANLADARAAGGDLRFTKLDVRSPDLPAVVARAQPDVVYHLAGSAPVGRPVDDAAASVLGALATLEAAREAGVGKVVVALSPAVYGAVGAASPPIREAQPRRPTTARGVAETAVAGYLEVYRDLHGVEHTTLVLDRVYGPRQDPHADATSVAGIAARVRAGQVVGVAPRAHDMVFVDDAVDALARAATRGGGLLLNVGTGVATTASELHSLVVAAVAPRSPQAVTRTGVVDGESPQTALDPARAGIHLGWSAWTPLAEGVAAAVS